MKSANYLRPLGATSGYIFPQVRGGLVPNEASARENLAEVKRLSSSSVTLTANSD